MRRRELVSTFVMLGLLLVAGVQPVRAQADPEKNDRLISAGDDIQIILPAIAGLTTVVLRDWEGLKQIVIGGGLTVAIVHATKYTVGSMRPDNSTPNSFPSGHTASAFYGPGFVHFRYGFKYAVPLYVGAFYVGYTRLLADRHWAGDVFFGATASLVMNTIFTTPYHGVQVKAGAAGGGMSIALEYTW